MLDLKKLQAGDMTDSDTITRYQSSTGSFSVRTSGCLIYTNNLTFSGLSCYWNGGNINFCGTLASGTLQKGLYGSGTSIGSVTTPYVLVYSGGYP
jgi:hypothetical protein